VGTGNSFLEKGLLKVSDDWAAFLFSKLMLEGAKEMKRKKEIITDVFLLMTFMVLTLVSPALLHAGSLPDTGQTKCYDNAGNEINPCPSPGQSFYGQDGNYTCNPHSYTLLAGGIMVQDNVTGLIWQKDTAPGTYNWDHAVSYCENLILGGYSDWRLPTIKELTTIVDSSIPYPGPTINTDYFPNTVSSFYWSSATLASILTTPGTSISTVAASAATISPTAPTCGRCAGDSDW